jgi:hypothetical protein
MSTAPEGERMDLFGRSEPRVYNVNKGAPPGAVYIGRAGHGERGTWGNPVALGRRCPKCGRIHGRDDIGAALACYRAILLRDLDRDFRYAAAFDRLHGRDLACFCAGTAKGLTRHDPLRCHGQVMLAVLDERRTLAERRAKDAREAAERAAFVEPERAELVTTEPERTEPETVMCGPEVAEVAPKLRRIHGPAGGTRALFLMLAAVSAWNH